MKKTMILTAILALVVIAGCKKPKNDHDETECWECKTWDSTTYANGGQPNMIHQVCGKTAALKYDASVQKPNRVTCGHDPAVTTCIACN